MFSYEYHILYMRVNGLVPSISWGQRLQNYYFILLAQNWKLHKGVFFRSKGILTEEIIHNLQQQPGTLRHHERTIHINTTKQ